MYTTKSLEKKNTHACVSLGKNHASLFFLSHKVETNRL